MIAEFLDAATEAAHAACALVVPFQRGVAFDTVEVKLDKSLVGHVDRTSEDEITRVLQRRLPGVPLIREESGVIAGESGYGYVILVDPIDGSRPLTSGAGTSTIIITLYDTSVGQMIAVVIADPATGRTWQASATKGCTLTSDSGSTTCRVWDGQMDDSCTLLIDNFKEFRRGDRVILSNVNCVSLFATLQSVVPIQNYGSNGIHHALVANGGPRVVGAITTSIGGAWDCGGAIAVAEAGGSILAYQIKDDRRVVERDPLDPMAYDILIVANNDQTMDVLSEAVRASIR